MSDETESMIVANLVMLVSRLIHQVRRFDPQNDTAEKAMGYLRRVDLVPSVLKSIEDRRKRGDY